MKMTIIICMISVVALFFAVVGCTSDGGVDGQQIANVISTIATTVSDQISSGNAANVVNQAVNAGLLDAETANSILAVLPLAQVASGVVNDVTTNVASAQPKFDKAMKAEYANRIEAILNANKSAVHPENISKLTDGVLKEAFKK